MKAILIDDEANAITLLQTLLNENCPEVKEIYWANELDEGVKLINEHKPDIVFLDIEMPKYSGLEIMDFFNGKKIDFSIVFVTAYDQYAIEAFKLCALDYILKPINPNYLVNAVAKCVDKKKENELTEKIDALKKLTFNTLAIEVPKGIIFLSYDEIQYLEADGSYTKIYTSKGNVELICKPLKFFVEQLDHNEYFFKCHRSYLVNIKYIKQFVKLDGGYLIMKNDIKLPFAKNSREEFSKVIEGLF
ncbi:LytR/AlgR family response regulator transcription factor [Pseudotenacibaculum haliotis]|uniref:LytR/AlgR family response regulator transcription factor n=1 Tax=Pseudotenacibaculum haliotis TaxID=1862138 RepID=A0ABW5LRG7_9FLAO